MLQKLNEIYVKLIQCLACNPGPIKVSNIQESLNEPYLEYPQSYLNFVQPLEAQGRAYNLCFWMMSPIYVSLRCAVHTSIY